jgi:hypothetical protein
MYVKTNSRRGRTDQAGFAADDAVALDAHDADAHALSRPRVGGLEVDRDERGPSSHCRTSASLSE